MYGKRTIDGKIIFGGDRRVEEGFPAPLYPVDMSSVQNNKSHVAEFFPWLQDEQIESSWTGVMPFTSDGLPVIGKLKDNLFVIGGMASGGMMQGPGAAKLLVQFILGCPKAEAILAGADPNRFQNLHKKFQKLDLNKTT